MELTGVVKSIFFKGDKITIFIFDCGADAKILVSALNDKFLVEQGKKYKAYISFHYRVSTSRGGMKCTEQQAFVESLEKVEE